MWPKTTDGFLGKGWIDCTAQHSTRTLKELRRDFRVGSQYQHMGAGRVSRPEGLDEARGAVLLIQGLPSDSTAE